MTFRSFLAQITLWSRIASFSVDQYLVYVNTRCICTAVCLAISGFGWVSFASKGFISLAFCPRCLDCSNDHEEKGVDPEDIIYSQGLNNLAKSSDSVIL